MVQKEIWNLFIIVKVTHKMNIKSINTNDDQAMVPSRYEEGKKKRATQMNESTKGLAHMN